MNRTDRWGDAAVDGLVMRGNTFTTAESIVLDGEFKTTNGVVIGATGLRALTRDCCVLT
eukprot:COSAG06_NODE_7139_length_2616_cov_1.464044_3_plen_59_part_00